MSKKISITAALSALHALVAAGPAQAEPNASKPAMSVAQPQPAIARGEGEAIIALKDYRRRVERQIDAISEPDMAKSRHMALARYFKDFDNAMTSGTPEEKLVRMQMALGGTMAIAAQLGASSLMRHGFETGEDLADLGHASNAQAAIDYYAGAVTQAAFVPPVKPGVSFKP